MDRWVDHPQVIFFRTLFRASRTLTVLWWGLLVVGGVLPAVFAVASGSLIRAVEGGAALRGPLAVIGIVFVSMQVINPLHEAMGQLLGRRTSDHMNDRLIRAATGPPGISHMEDPERANDLSMARDFDLGITGPPLFVAMGFIAGGLQPLLGGLAAAVVLFGFTWWAPLVLVAGWGSTHLLLKESGVWRDRNTDEVRTAQRHADYAYSLAVDAPAAKELRLFGLGDWVVDRFAERRRRLFELYWEATRLRERSVLSSLLAVSVANALVFWRLAAAVADGSIPVGDAVVYLMAAIMVSSMAFGALSWALDTSAAPAAAVDRLVALFAATETLTAPSGSQATGIAPSGPSAGAHTIEFRNVGFTYPRASGPVLSGLDLRIEAGTSLAIVGQNGAGKTTLAKLLCRFYDPDEGLIEVDGRPLTDLDLDLWRSRVTAVFQDFVRYELSLRENVAPLGAPDEVIRDALAAAGADGLVSGPHDLDTPLSKGYPGGIDLSGGQWQRVALARAICGVKLGAGLVLLDEPTAQLDVRGETEIFRRLLEATSRCTTILISHRFSTVRLAERIAVVEGGRVIELGTHGELMALGGRYETMYSLQASRFVEVDAMGEEMVYDRLD
ncbi:MAG: ABC transporter ATP-binding protein/permease [Acidimicrobiia bacterium]|nr:ABC transporter ATP-binding protein/permease [Acidimicrobiia bacterium]